MLQLHLSDRQFYCLLEVHLISEIWRYIYYIYICVISSIIDWHNLYTENPLNMRMPCGSFFMLGRNMICCGDDGVNLCHISEDHFFCKYTFYYTSYNLYLVNLKQNWYWAALHKMLSNIGQMIIRFCIHHSDVIMSNRLFGRRSKNLSKLRVTGLCEGN